MVAHPSTRRHLSKAALVAALICLALAARLLPGQRIVDDAYITFRYARNLARGTGFVYNPGERVLGTTTPLYTLVLAALAAGSGSQDFPALAVAANAVFGAGTVGVLYLLAKRCAGHAAPAATVALLWAIAPYSVTFAIGGMETDLAILLLVGCAYVHILRRPRWLAVLSALALLARPDAALLLVPLWLDLALRPGLRAPWPRPWRALPWREALLALAVLAPWLVFSVLTYGSPLPRSIAAKSAAYRLPPGTSLVRLLQHYATPFFEHNLLPPLGVVIAFALYCGLATLGGLHTLRRERSAWPLIAYPVVYFATFALTNPLLFRWYLSPPLPFYFLLIITGAWNLASLPGRLTEQADRARAVHAACPAHRRARWAHVARPLLFAPVAFWALGLTLNAWQAHPDHGPDRPAPKMAWFQLEQLYGRAAQVVLAHATSGGSLCAGDIGRLGYETDLPILDTVGLVTPEATRYYPADPALYVTVYAIPPDLVLTLDPDFIVILEVYGRVGLLPDPRFRARYVLLKTIATDIYGSNGMLIFERRHMR